MNKPTIYIASKVQHAPVWKQLKAGGAPIISSGIDEAGPDQTPNFSELWVKIIKEIDQCHLLLFYMSKKDISPPKGAFVEVGIALSKMKRVYTVAEGISLKGRTLRPVGSWLYHPLVTIVPTVNMALHYFKMYREYGRPL